MSIVVLAIVLFAATNVDDLVVLLALFADPKLRSRQIALGQSIGIAVLLLVSLVASRVSLVVAPAWIGLLGILPLLIGLKRLAELRQPQGAGEEVATMAGPRAVLAVAALTLANGGDNIAIYTPVLAHRSAAEVMLIGVVFGLLTALWLWLARWFCGHPRLGMPIRSYGRRIVPLVLIGIGLLTLREGGSLAMLATLGRAAGRG